MGFANKCSFYELYPVNIYQITYAIIDWITNHFRVKWYKWWFQLEFHSSFFLRSSVSKNN